jgi:hypothetical protein
MRSRRSSLLALLTFALLVSTVLAPPTWADDPDTHPSIGAVGAGPAGRTILASAMASADLAAPDQPGPYKVGFTTFPSTVGDNLPTTITVWYPHCAVGSAGCSSNPPGTPTYLLTTFRSPNPQVMVRSPLGAVEDASVQQGSFPMVVWSHGGPAFTRTRARQRLDNFPLMEHLASHGFIAASYERNNAGLCSNELAGPRDVITRLLTRNATAGDLFAGRIDPGKIGAMALSAGGFAGYSLLTGADPSDSLPLGLPPDARVKALVVTEASHEGCGITLARKQAVTRPYMVMGGSPEFYESTARQPFNEMVNASPRILVKTITKANNPNLNAEHLSYGAGDCDLTDAIREGSLRLQQASGQDPLVEPLTSAFGSDPSIVDDGARVLAAEARGFWNNAVQLFLRQKTFCNRVGTDPNGILPIGVPSPDGLVTSTPPFEPSPFVDADPPFTACSPVRCITGERMTRMLKLFTTSFWKAYLQGDQRYSQFLTRGYSNQEPEAIITRDETATE